MYTTIASRISAIRTWLLTNQVDALIIPHEDEYLGEYVPECNERLQWATGFTGSAGTAIITATTAAIFVDGRYTVQVTKQVPATEFSFHHSVDEPITDWIANQEIQIDRIAFDPRMHTANWYASTGEKLLGKTQLVALENNPIDELWLDRPLQTVSPVRLMPTSYTGLSSEDKRNQIASEIRKLGADAAVLTQLDSICWLLNIRGLDVSRLPVLLSHAIAYSDASVDFFLDPARLPSDFKNHVGSGVKVRHPTTLKSTIENLSGKRVLTDPVSSNAWFSLQLECNGAIVIDSPDPCLQPKAAKHPVEISGMKAAHIRDGVAMAKFLSWLDNEVANNHYRSEAELSDQLQKFREQDEQLVDLSFDTISAAGSNAAMCHYNHNDQAEPGVLSPDTLYLVDSGGQYPDGTTDITRTIAIGNPTDEMKKQFTLVLKGHIAMNRARFPKGTTGHQLDILARQHLWAEGFDYDHGTGHGVGHFLSVHEGPQSISKVAKPIALVAGMIVSNEPGYYRAEGFGIRIENLELVVEIETGGDFSVLGFESLTRCPIDKRNIEVSLLTKTELCWLNAYHQTVWDKVSPLLDNETQFWLKNATLPLSH